MAGQQDLWPWLQSIMQNQGAGQPMNPNAIPGAAPQAMPGSGVNGMPAMTQGGPSMGYPAMGQPGPSPQAPFPAGPSPMSATTPASPMMPPSWPMPDNAPNNLYQTASHATASAVDSSGDDQPVSPRWENMPYPGQIDPRGYFAPKTAQGAAGSSGASPQTYPHMPWPDTGAPAGSPSATPRPVDSGAKGPLASPTNTATPMKRTAGAPNLGYYQPSNRFIGIDQPNASPQNSMRAGPQATALNLGGLFGGRGQQPAANPANVPAANAQPVSSLNNPGIRPAGPLPASAEDNAPWWMGPLQQGNIWKGSGGPSGRINR